GSADELASSSARSCPARLFETGRAPGDTRRRRREDPLTGATWRADCVRPPARLRATAPAAPARRAGPALPDFVTARDRCRRVDQAAPRGCCCTSPTPF